MTQRMPESTGTVTCGSAQCGSFNPTATGSGSATVYTAPAAVPTPATVTLTATSVTDTTKSTSATITITAAAPPGHRGWDIRLSPVRSRQQSELLCRRRFHHQERRNHRRRAGLPPMPLTSAMISSSPANSSVTATTGNIQLVFATTDSNIGS